MKEFVFSFRDLEMILNALSYTHWNDRELTEDDRNYMDSLYQAIDNSTHQDTCTM